MLPLCSVNLAGAGGAKFRGFFMEALLSSDTASKGVFANNGDANATPLSCVAGTNVRIADCSYLPQRLQEPIGSSRPRIAVGYGPDWRSRDKTDCRARVKRVCADRLSFLVSIERVSIDWSYE